MDDERRRRFHWLLVGAGLFFLGGLLLTTTVWLGLGYWPLLLGQLAITAAVAVMASNVTAYRLLINVEVVRGDLLYGRDIGACPVKAGARRTAQVA